MRRFSVARSMAGSIRTPSGPITGTSSSPAISATSSSALAFMLCTCATCVQGSFAPAQNAPPTRASRIRSSKSSATSPSHSMSASLIAATDGAMPGNGGDRRKGGKVRGWRAAPAVISEGDSVTVHPCAATSRRSRNRLCHFFQKTRDNVEIVAPGRRAPLCNTRALRRAFRRILSDIGTDYPHPA